MTSSTSQGGEERAEVLGERAGEEVYLFRAGVVPPYRQMFYQYGDIHLPEVVTILAAAASDRCDDRWDVRIAQ